MYSLQFMKNYLKKSKSIQEFYSKRKRFVHFSNICWKKCYGVSCSYESKLT